MKFTEPPVSPHISVSFLTFHSFITFSPPVQFYLYFFLLYHYLCCISSCLILTLLSSLTSFSSQQWLSPLLSINFIHFLLFFLHLLLTFPLSLCLSIAHQSAIVFLNITSVTLLSLFTLYFVFPHFIFPLFQSQNSTRISPLPSFRTLIFFISAFLSYQSPFLLPKYSIVTSTNFALSWRCQSEIYFQSALASLVSINSDFQS